MPNKLVVIISSLKVPKINTILLYEMKFLVPKYSCLQNPWLVGYHPQIPVLSVLNWICWTPPPRTKFLGTPLQVTSADFLLSITRALRHTLRPARHSCTSGNLFSLKICQTKERLQETTFYDQPMDATWKVLDLTHTEVSADSNFNRHIKSTRTFLCSLS
jgi:hypothetical protein